MQWRNKILGLLKNCGVGFFDEMEHAVSEHTIDVSDETFEDVVLSNDQPVLVDFWAEWCGPCVAFAPKVNAVANEFNGRLVVAKVDIDKNKRWADKLGVRSIPTLLYFYKGQLVRRSLGGVAAGKLKLEIENFLKETGADSTHVSAEAQSRFDEQLHTADTRMKDRIAAGLKVYHELPELAELERIRRPMVEQAEQLAAADKAKLEAGEITTEKYQEALGNAFRVVHDDPKNAELIAEIEKALEGLKTDSAKKAQDKFFAEIAAAEQEYDAAVDAARKELAAAGK
jgi:thioredoxin 1